MRKVAIVPEAIFRLDNLKYMLREEMVAESVKQILDGLSSFKDLKGDLLDVFGIPAEEPTPPQGTLEELEHFRKDMQMTRGWGERSSGEKIEVFHHFFIFVYVWNPNQLYHRLQYLVHKLLIPTFRRQFS
ncbi:MAG: hypothetical protein U9O89_03965 [Thermoproteota archaeon]|nr:hypothetical protein [Thermoproteota archaeon]